MNATNHTAALPVLTAAARAGDREHRPDLAAGHRHRRRARPDHRHRPRDPATPPRPAGPTTGPAPGPAPGSPRTRYPRPVTPGLGSPATPGHRPWPRPGECLGHGRPCRGGARPKAAPASAGPGAPDPGPRRTGRRIPRIPAGRGPGAGRARAGRSDPAGWWGTLEPGHGLSRSPHDATPVMAVSSRRRNTMLICWIRVAYQGVVRVGVRVKGTPGAPPSPPVIAFRRSPHRRRPIARAISADNPVCDGPLIGGPPVPVVPCPGGPPSLAPARARS